ncbi:MAG: hypothetical protein M3450_10885 [Actinomycetota bacterium]|nr:hypothetical protein [Actinomycetota bacterium]MDQ3641936.1 hypothetical protein [Actinomycetota bacterium]
MPGLLAALMAKLAAMGTVAKAAIATATAALTMAAAGGAAGVLPLPGGDSGPGVVSQTAVDQATAAVGPATSSLPPAMSGGTGAQTTSGASVTPPSAATSARAGTGPATAASTNSAAVPNAAVPAIPAMPSCVASLIPTGGAMPDPARLATQLPACILSVVRAHLPLDAIQSAIGSANLPVNVAGCLSSVLGSVPGFMGGDLSGLSQLVSACMPSGSVPGTGSMPTGQGSFSGFRAGR